LNVAVIGAGIAGTAASIFLARGGHRVTLFEQVPALRAVGAGLLLQPTGLAVLARLGLLEVIEAAGAPVARLFGTIPSGRTILDLRYADVAPGLRGVGIHRGTLCAALWSELDRCGVQVRLGTKIVAIAQDDTGVALRIGGKRDAHRSDIVVVADGTFSRLREALPIRQRTDVYPWGAWWTIVPDRERRFQGVLRQWYRRAVEMLGVMPIGRSPAAADDTPHVTLFWSVRRDGEVSQRRRGLSAWKDAVLGLAPDVAPLLDEVREPAQLLFATYADVRMNRWNDRRAVIIGDAAHATSPQLGQGANLALIDAQVLAGCIAATADPLPALAAYTATRRAHLRYYQWASSVLTPVFQSEARVLPLLRDATMGMIGRVPALRAPMLATLTGAKTGMLRGTLRLD
jgi:2-polyprenyl-6-methoxyphenol hydroxylase-like FAD-dependent oxidoreductase